MPSDALSVLLAAAPPLTVLVVNRTGEPGGGLPLGGKTVGEQRERVFAFDWFDIEPPESDDFLQTRDPV